MNNNEIKKKKQKKKNYSIPALFLAISFSFANFSNNIEKEDNTINSLEKAEKLGYLDKNTNYDDLIEAVYNNSNLLPEEKFNLYLYIKNLCEKEPNIDKAILKRNIELLNIKIVKDSEAIGSSPYTAATFNKKKHLITIKEKIVPIESGGDLILSHEFSHMLSTLYDENEDYIIDIDFTCSNHGYSIDEQFTSLFTDRITYSSENAYNKENIKLLQYIIGKEKVKDILLNENINDLEDELSNINDKIDSTHFVSLSDEQQDLLKDSDLDNNHNVDYELYKMYIDYFISSADLDYDNFIEYADNFRTYIKYWINIDSDDKEKLINYYDEETTKVFSNEMQRSENKKATKKYIYKEFPVVL